MILGLFLHFILLLSVFYFWGTYTFLSFVTAFIVGALILWIPSRLYPSFAYGNRLFHFLMFLAYFVVEFVLANLSVALTILFVPNSKINPTLFYYDVEGLSKLEGIILSHTISLTPGTVSVELSEKKSVLTVHCLNSSENGEKEKREASKLKELILRFTR